MSDIPLPSLEKKPSFSKKGLLGGAVIIALAIAGFIAYLSYTHYYPSTDDSYVQANVATISSQVSGMVSAVPIHDLSEVEEGQLLFQLDARPFQIAVDKARAQLQRTQEIVKMKEEAIEAASADVERNQALLNYAVKDNERVSALVKKGQATAAEGDQVQRNLAANKASVASAKSNLAKAISDFGNIGEQNAEIQQAKAVLAEAELDLSYTRITAPAKGQVVNLTLRTGDTVTADAPLFAIIEESEWWVQANFKETDLARIRPGQPATITIDIYPNHTFKGIVESLSQGSGAAFSLLPPENATGNWVKVTQRFPVRIRIVDLDPQFPLRIGASATVTVDTVKNTKAAS